MGGGRHVGSHSDRRWSGTDDEAAQSQVYSRIKNVMIPNMYYRTDIGDRWDEDSDRLHNWGILR